MQSINRATGTGIFALLLCVGSSAPAVETGKAFDTPENAVAALGDAVNSTNRAAFTALFGPQAEALANPDSVQGAQELGDFAAAFNATNHLVRESDQRMVLEVGNN